MLLPPGPMGTKQQYKDPSSDQRRGQGDPQDEITQDSIGGFGVLEPEELGDEDTEVDERDGCAEVAEVGAFESWVLDRGEEN